MNGTSGIAVDPRRVDHYLVAYFVVLHAVPFLNMLLGGIIPVYIVVSVVASYSGWLTIRYLHQRVTVAGQFSPLELAVTAYLLLSAVSFLLFFQPNHPAPTAAFAYGVHRLLMPACLFFAVKSTDAGGRLRLIRWICLLSVWLIVVGAILHFARPPFYSDFLTRYYSTTTVEATGVYARMISYLGSTLIGIVAAGTIALVPSARFSTAAGAVVVAIMVAGASLAQQRGGFVATLIALGYYLFASRGTIRSKVIAATVGGLLLTAAVMWVSVSNEEVLQLLLHRFSSIGEALGERSYSYIIAMSYFRDFPFGAGLGTTAPTDLNLRGEITDGNFMRIFADLGPIGLLLFLSVVVMGIGRAARSSGGGGWIVMLIVYCIVALGTNVFDTYYAGHLFWAALGMVDALPESSFVQGRAPRRTAQMIPSRA